MPKRPEEIDAEVAFELHGELRAQFVDARPTSQYERSSDRIPDAVHLDPGGGAELTQALLALAREKMIVAYCDEPAHAASSQVARRARALGLGDASFLRGGLTAWKQAGLPTEVLPPTRREASRYVISDQPDGAAYSVWANSLADLFAEAGRGLADALGEPRDPTDLRAHELHFEAGDREGLLLLFLNDLITRSKREARLFRDVDVRSVSDQHLDVTVVGVEVDGWRLAPYPRDLPAVRVREQSDGLLAEVTVYRHR